jgi:N-acetylglucosaminyldiphosphoundecaprenol N-acetyl-beta-D-mannosaminyltransferase
MKVSLLDVQIDKVTMEESVEKVAGFIKSGQPHRVLTLNPEFLYRAQSDPGLMELTRRADLVTPDGIGIVWACRMAGYQVIERVTGIDLMMSLAARAAAENWRIYLLGAAPGVAEEAAVRLCRDYPGLQVVGTHHGYFNMDKEAAGVAEIVRQARPQLLFAALGAPKQEQWIDRYIEQTGASAALGVGGSFDVIAGRVKRAPVLSQRLHLEWLARLIREPARWRRQLVLPRFAWMVLKRYRL